MNVNETLLEQVRESAKRLTVIEELEDLSKNFESKLDDLYDIPHDELYSKFIGLTCLAVRLISKNADLSSELRKLKEQ